MGLISSREQTMLDEPVAASNSNHVRQPSTRNNRTKPPMPDRDELEGRFTKVLELMRQKEKELEQKFEQFKEEYEAEQQMILKRKVTEIAAQHRQERDREIEKAIESMEQEAQARWKELQEALRRNKEQYEIELKELAETKQATLRRYQDAQARVRHTEDRCAELEVTISQLKTRNKILTQELTQERQKEKELEQKFEQFKEEYEAEQQMILKRKLTEIAAQHHQERDREIKKAIETMEQEAQARWKELQEALRRNKEQYEIELKELAETKQATLRRYQDAQARVRHTEDRCAELEVTISQLKTRNKILTQVRVVYCTYISKRLLE